LITGCVMGTDRMLRPCPECGEQTYEGYFCRCGGDPWSIVDPWKVFQQRIREAIDEFNKGTSRQYTISRTDWTSEEEPTCQACGEVIPLEDSPKYMFIVYKGKQDLRRDGFRCIWCTAKYLRVEPPVEPAIPNAWFNNRSER